MATDPDEGDIFEIPLSIFAAAVQGEADLAEQILTEDSPEAAWLRGIFSEEFLKEKKDEADAYIENLRKRAAEQEES